MRNHPENDGSYIPTTRTEYEVIERAESIARGQHRRHIFMDSVCIGLGAIATCDLNYIAVPQSVFNCEILT